MKGASGLLAGEYRQSSLSVLLKNSRDGVCELRSNVKCEDEEILFWFPTVESYGCDFNRISSCLFYLEHEELVTHHSLIRTISNAWGRVRLNHSSFLPAKTTIAFNLPQSIYFPTLELFLLLLVLLFWVAPLYCLLKVKRSGLNSNLAEVWLIPDVSKEIASLTLHVLPVLVHQQWAITVIIHLKTNKKRSIPLSKQLPCREKVIPSVVPPVWLLCFEEKSMIELGLGNDCGTCAGQQCSAMQLRFWPCTWERICTLYCQMQNEALNVQYLRWSLNTQAQLFQQGAFKMVLNRKSLWDFQK